jgi:hypothetical protein
VELCPTPLLVVIHEEESCKIDVFTGDLSGIYVEIKKIVKTIFAIILVAPILLCLFVWYVILPDNDAIVDEFAETLFAHPHTVSCNLIPQSVESVESVARRAIR